MAERMFDPCCTTKSAGTGPGMGLSAVHRLLHERGGHIIAKSNRVGGASFCCLLPPAQDDFVAVDERAFFTQAASVENEQQHIVVVDDKQQICCFIATLLQSRGDRVSAFTEPVAVAACFKLVEALADPNHRPDDARNICLGTRCTRLQTKFHTTGDSMHWLPGTS
jgi:hypothetical protein